MEEEQVQVELRRLKHERQVIEARLERMSAFVDNAGNQDIMQLELRLRAVEDDFCHFNPLQTRIEYLNEEASLERIAIEDAFYRVMAAAKNLIKAQTNIIIGTATSNNNSTNPLTRLPELVLPTFNGSYETWVSFYELFMSAVHDRPELTDVQRFLYLKTCCKQDALKLIDSIEVTANNYKIALDLLKKRYENKRALMNCHINGLLFGLPEVQRDSFQSLRKLLDTVFQHVSVLEKLKLPTKEWDALLVPLILRKLDDKIRQSWEGTLQEDCIPSLNQLTDFLSRKCFTMETMYEDISKPSNQNKSQHTQRKFDSGFKPERFYKPNQVYMVSESNPTCPVCGNSHFIYYCPKFGNLSSEDKYQEIKRHKLCSNCLRRGHFKNECQSTNCKKCSLKHNTLLHVDKPISTTNLNRKISYGGPNVSNPTVKREETHTQGSTTLEPTTSHSRINQGRTFISSDGIANANHPSEASLYVNLNVSQVFLSTATVLIDDSHGRSHECTALLDSGSQSNLISQTLCDKLDLSLEYFCIPITGVSKKVTHIRHRTIAMVRSRFNSFETKLTFLVLPTITGNVPLIGFNEHDISYPRDINLADKYFNIPKPIDLLLGANIFYELLAAGKIRLGKNLPLLQETVFGWIFAGTLGPEVLDATRSVICHLSTEAQNVELNKHLTKFWEIEELPQKNIMSREAQKCESYFEQTTTRNSEGRFVVRLPFCENSSKSLGESRLLALKRFNNLKSRLARDENLQHEYNCFMNEYESLGHMTRKCAFQKDDSTNNDFYFLPHHAVIKQSSTTTKCRVVFDASAKTSTNVSLNDLLLVGPTVQNDLFSIVLRFRLRKVVLNADLKMMYRQILVHPDDRNYQQILWNNEENENIQVYKLNTITYGTACAPFLATRCLQQLADEHKNIFPRTCKIISSSFYMDDLLVSVDTTEEAVEIYKELTLIFNTAGFSLRKWSSNEPTILEMLMKEANNEEQYVILHDKRELKPLGISWHPTTDKFTYSINIPQNHSTVTKRLVLSVIAQIYDPLGLIGPAVLPAKILMQHLWQLKINWDDHIPEEMNQFWLTFVKEMYILNNTRINRHVLITQPIRVEIHGFSDASERAYGACIYLLSIDSMNHRKSSLLCAKSRVAPIKKFTLPRLELLGACLLANLVDKVRQTLDVEIAEFVLYTDSTIVLAWMKIEPTRLKTFVANRITQILELTNLKSWHHVTSKNNAADVLSRGIIPSDLLNLGIWWHGPSFLIERSIETEIPVEIEYDIPELKEITVSLAVTSIISDLNIFVRFSCLIKLQRVVAYMLRFRSRALHKIKITSIALSTNELQESLTCLIRLAQQETFVSEIAAIRNHKHLETSSKLLALNPFLDKNDLLRVGGRLSKSLLQFENKHPIILPSKHKFTSLIIKHEHLKHLHMGVQNLLSIIRLIYWPINGKNTVKHVLRSCMQCFRANPKAESYFMGDLPKDRVIPSRPFANCGVDYAGPIWVKDGTLRRAKLVKTYICIFVCFAIRAVHIELVSDLSTDNFLNALKRFISRRGKPVSICSDNGLNFVGARNHFQELYDLVNNRQHNAKVNTFLANDQIKWVFNPPHAPHMGGLWEASVKSTKFHLRRVLANATLNYEAMYTILVQIEACLNSRPLCPLSNDPNDFLPLTPAHFLIGNSLAATPQDDVLDITPNRLNRYQQLQHLLRGFWRRWSAEYLQQLQVRNKWRRKLKANLELGTLVILKEDGLPPLQWRMARIVQLHKGADNILRVVSVKTACGKIFTRSLNKICILPRDND